MNKVTTINLNGRAYQLEERGFDALRKYLETAAAKLQGNPDKDEIMADFEQAIADKCDQKLAGHKNVISEKEIEEIIAAMGPVDGAGENVGNTNGPVGSSPGRNSADVESGNIGDSNNNTKSGTSPRRLFRIVEGEWIMGVCTGLAAYFNLDVTLVRVIFILLTLLSHGFWIAAYVILAVVMPAARTEEERARAHGDPTNPAFNAHDFIERAKAGYAQLQKMHEEHKSKEEINKKKRELKQEMRDKKHQMKQEWRERRHDWREWNAEHSSAEQDYGVQRYGAGYHISRAVFGFFAVLVSIVLLALSVAWVVALVTLIKYGTVFGYSIGTGHPLWISIVFLTAAFYIIAAPFRLLIHHAWGTIDHRSHRQSGWAEAGRAFIFLGILVILFLTARELFPQVNDWWNAMVATLTIQR